MSTWLKLLPLEISEVDELIEPIDEIKEGETVVGVVSDELKKLWTLCKAGRKSAEIFEVEQRYAPSPSQDRAKSTELLSKARAMEMIFWIGAFDELHMWGHPEQYALRMGWKVVEFKMSDSPFKFFLGNQQ